MTTTLMNEWPLKRLKDITSKIGSGATPRGGQSSYRNEGISLIRSLNVYDFSFSAQDLAFIGEEQAAALDNVVVQKNDILLNITGASVARCCLTDPKFLPARVNQHVAIVRVRPDKADARFVLYCINSPRFKKRLLALSQGGATREALTKNTIEEFEVFQPPLAVQQRIGGILSAYDGLIENSQRRIRILETMARALYREWFVYFRFPGYEKIKLIDSALGKIPQGWEVSEFRNLFEIKYGKTLPKSEIAESGAYPVYGAGDVIGYYDRVLCPEKCALITSRGNGSGTVWRTRQAAFVTNNSLIVVPKERFGYWNYSFVELTLEHSNVMGAKTGSAQPQMTIENLNYVKAIVPPRHLVEKFCEFALPMNEQVDLLLSKCTNLHRTRDLLLPRMFSGQIDLSGVSREELLSA